MDFVSTTLVKDLSYKKDGSRRDVARMPKGRMKETDRRTRTLLRVRLAHAQKGRHALILVGVNVERGQCVSTRKVLAHTISLGAVVAVEAECGVMRKGMNTHRQPCWCDR